MDLSETIDLREPKDHAAGPGDRVRAYGQCDQCGAAVDGTQRYCVVCGTHLKAANDPAARYFGRAGGSRSAARPQRPARPAARGRGLGSALVLALIPVAAAIGVLAGRSSNNDDAKLIQALSHRQPSVTVSGAATAAGPTAGGPARSAGGPRSKSASAKAHAANTSSTKHVAASAGTATSSTSDGPVHQITGFRATKSAEQQGAKATQQVQKSTGKSYVNSQNNLPSQVVVP